MKSVKYIMLIFVAMIILPLAVHAHTVTMNMKFAGNGSVYANSLPVAQDSIFVNMSKKYLLAVDGNNVFVFVSAGSEFISASAKIQERSFQITQGDDNRFIIAYTKGSWQNFDNNYESIGNMPARTIGDLNTIKRETFPIYLQLQYVGIDIISDLLWIGQKTLIVRNEGRNDRGLVKVSITSK